MRIACMHVCVCVGACVHVHVCKCMATYARVHKQRLEENLWVSSLPTLWVLGMKPMLSGLHGRCLCLPTANRDSQA